MNRRVRDPVVFAEAGRSVRAKWGKVARSCTVDKRVGCVTCTCSKSNTVSTGSNYDLSLTMASVCCQMRLSKCKCRLPALRCEMR